MVCMRKFLIICSLLMTVGVEQAQAQSGDALIEGTKLCTRHLPRYERQYGIPTHLLSAIASTESGRYHEGLGLRLPWPWTINAEGKGYYFDSKQEAVTAAKKLRSHGIKSMDVGCMQVNLMHHPNAFGSLDDAFEPQKNIAYAASFLRNLYEEDHSWKTAAAGYHSKTPALGREYAVQVYNSWYQIIDKLRAAKLVVPETSVAAMNDLKPLKTASLPTPFKPQGKTIRIARAESYKSPVLNSMKITHSSPDNRQNDVIIVKPDIKFVDSPSVASKDTPQEMLIRDPITLADAKPAGGGSARVIRVNGESSVKSTTVRTGGPNFVFSD